MTARRMALLALAAFALLVVARPPRPTGLPYGVRAERAMSAAGRARRVLTATRDTLRVVEYSLWSGKMRDSVRRVLDAVPVGKRDGIFIDSRLPASARRHIEDVYRASRARMASGKMALPMFVVLDTAQSYRLGTMLWVEAVKDAAPACATVMRVRISGEALRDERRLLKDAHRVVSANFPQPRHFGLCGFEAVFGTPSQPVRRWLREREYRPVASGYDPSRAPRAPLRLRDNVIPFFASENNGARALDMRACVAGRAERCLNAIAPVADGPVADVDAVTSDWRWWGWLWGGSQDVMNTLATGMGPDAFGALWRGDASPPETYQRLTGVPIDTHARRVLLGDAPPMRVGAGVSISDVVVSLLLAMLFVGFATLSHPRQRRR
ncbi:MAG: hypothetical protein ACYC7F_08385 [Gemmatimonadaceae bacterium]